MFVGHFALGFAAKRIAPRTSAATLVVAAQFVDLVWPILLLVGAEEVHVRGGPNPFLVLDFVRYPWTHSLLMGVGWAIAFALAYRARTGYARGAAVCGALVLSHWILDFATHVPDLQLAPGLSARVGLGLWRSVPATLVIELAIYVAGVAVYARTTRAIDRAGSVGFWSFVALLVALYFANFGGAPPSATAVAVATLFGWAFVPWVAWFDRHRVLRRFRCENDVAGQLARTAR
jgi:hypothetical protein